VTTLKTYLIVDDDSTRIRQHYAPVLGQVALQETRYRDRIKFITAITPRTAIEILEHNGHRLSGVLADCDLSAHRDAAEHSDKRAIGTDPTGTHYTVSTGIGVLDWTHRNLAKVPTWTIIDTTALHSPLYASAALLWFGSQPLDITWFDVKNRAGLIDTIEHPLNPKDHNTLWPTVRHTSGLFEELMDAKHYVDSFDWLHAMATLPRRNRSRIPGRRGDGGFGGQVQDRLRDLTGESVPINTQRLCYHFAAWQSLLKQIYQGFDVRDGAMRWSEWPDVEEEHLRAGTIPRNITYWDAFNPFTDILGEVEECQRFFKAPDTRLALHRYRACTGHPAKDDG